MESKPLVISAGLYGAAEVVLRAIAQQAQSGVSCKVEDTEKLRRRDFHWTKAGGVFVATGFFEKEGGVVLPVSLLLGKSEGLFLKDVSTLSRRQLFSTRHFACGSNGYVMPIDPRILEHSNQHNIRLVVNEVCAFRIKHSDQDLLELRKAIESAREQKSARGRSWRMDLIRRKEIRNSGVFRY